MSWGASSAINCEWCHLAVASRTSTLRRPFRKQPGHPARSEAGREREAQWRARTFGDKDAPVYEGGDHASSLAFACAQDVCSVGAREFSAVNDRFDDRG